MYIGLTLSFVGLALVIWIKDPLEPIIMTSPKVYSWYQTDPLETVKIDLATNVPDSYYVDPTYISQVSIEEDEQVISMDVITIVVETDSFVFEDGIYFPVHVYLRPSILPSHSVLSFPSASITIAYNNGEEYSFLLGEVNYLFEDTMPDHLGLAALDASYEEVENIETVSAIQVSLTNRTSGLVDILRVEVLATSVATNLPMSIRDIDCNNTSKVEECLGVTSYNFTLPRYEKLLHMVVLPSQEVTIYVPLLYDTVRPFHRFVILVYYQYNGEEHMFIMDDFPFMTTSSFQPDYEQEYQLYALDQN